MKKVFSQFPALLCFIFVFSLILFSVSTGRAEQSDMEEQYRRALLLKEDCNYDAAYDILKSLINSNSESSKYQILYTDVLLERMRDMKDVNNAAWKETAKESSQKIKALYGANRSNSDYYLVYAKYSWLTDAKRDSHITKALEKAFYYRPGYGEAYIVKGDIYFGLSKTADTTIQQDSTSLTGGSGSSSKHHLAITSKAAYESALASTGLSDKRKAYVYYMMGELEDQILQNKNLARADWEKTISLSPESRVARKAKDRLGK